jgi:hypothetical protein
MRAVTNNANCQTATPKSPTKTKGVGKPLNKERESIMSTYRKALKVLSIISLVFSVLSLILGVFIVGGSVANPDTVLETVSAYPLGMSNAESLQVVMGIGVVLALFSLVEVFVSAMGIRGANNPSKMGFVTVVAGITAAISVIGTVAGLAQGAGSFGSVLTTVVYVAFFFICYKVREEGKQGA